MAAILPRPSRGAAPLYAMFIAGMVPLFLGVLFSDWAYSSTYELQWKNFASWLLVGGLILCGFALLWAFVDLARAKNRSSGAILLNSLLLATWLLGFINALVHAKDAWASMPTALVLSIVVAALSTATAWIGLSLPRETAR